MPGSCHAWLGLPSSKLLACSWTTLATFVLEGEPAPVARKAAKPAAAAPAAAAAPPAAAEAGPIAYTFAIDNDKVEGKTNPQIKALLQTAFFGWVRKQARNQQPARARSLGPQAESSPRDCHAAAQSNGRGDASAGHVHAHDQHPLGARQLRSMDEPVGSMTFLPRRLSVRLSVCADILIRASSTRSASCRRRTRRT